MFFINGIRYLGRIAKEVKIFADSSSIGSALGSSAKGIVVEIITGFLKSVAQAIVGIFEIKAEVTTLAWPSFGDCINLHFLVVVLEGL